MYKWTKSIYEYVDGFRKYFEEFIEGNKIFKKNGSLAEEIDEFCQIDLNKDRKISLEGI
jgi:hypothetical protein